MNRSAAVNLLKYAIGLGLLAFVVARNWEGKVGPNGNAVPGLRDLLAQTPDVAYLAAAAGCLVAATAIQFYRWYLLVRALGLPFTVRNTFRLGMVGYFYNTFLPGSVGGDLVKAVFIAKEQAGRRAAAVATVLADRLLGLFGLLLFASAVGGACWAAGDPRITNSDWLRHIIRVTGGLVMATVVGWVLLGFLPEHRAERFAGRLAKLPAGATFVELWMTVWAYRQRSAVIYKAVALSAACHTLMVLLFHFAVRIYPVADPGALPEHFVLAPIGYIGQAFFPAPGGVGGGEAIFGYLYTLVDRPETSGVIGRLALRMLEWTLGLCGYVAYLRMRAELPGTKDESSAAVGIGPPVGLPPACV